MDRIELMAKYDSRKSFYKKAYVVMNGDRALLLSYDTPICEAEGGKLIFDKKYFDEDNLTQTTLRHVREFAKQYANYFGVVSKKAIIKSLGL